MPAPPAAVPMPVGAGMGYSSARRQPRSSRGARFRAWSASSMPVAFNALLEAFEFISSDPMFGNSARVNRETGEVHWHSDWDSELFEEPDDIDDDAKYLSLPSPRDLDLGKPLVMAFAAERLDHHYDEVAAIFSRKGAYGRFKDFLIRVGALDSWYEYENAAREKALREWCAENGIEVEG